MKKEALIIVDMSNDFVANNGSLTAGKPAQDIVPYIVKLANKFLSEKNVVVVTMDSHQENDKHFELWPAHNVIGTEGQQLYGELNSWYKENIKNENLLYVPKTNYNAFFNTTLAAKLKYRNVDKVHIVGVCTDICDFLTVAGADAEGFKTAVHTKGMATFTQNVPDHQNLMSGLHVPSDLFIKQMKLCFHTEIIN